ATQKLYWSVRWSAPWPISCSGAMYVGVPISLPGSVSAAASGARFDEVVAPAPVRSSSGERFSGSPRRARARPKSSTRGRPSLPHTRVSGFNSPGKIAGSVGGADPVPLFHKHVYIFPPRPLLFREPLGERAPLHVLHRNEYLVGDGSNVVNSDDVGVRQL